MDKTLAYRGDIGGVDFLGGDIGRHRRHGALGMPGIHAAAATVAAMYVGVVLNRRARKNRLGGDDRSAQLPRLLGSRGELPALFLGMPVRGDRLRDTVGRTMTIAVEEGEEPLSPIIDGERFSDLDRLRLAVGPRVRIARPT